jgi:NADH:ubiquinone oxidoreductase subunit H
MALCVNQQLKRMMYMNVHCFFVAALADFSALPFNCFEQDCLLMKGFLILDEVPECA